MVALIKSSDQMLSNGIHVFFYFKSERLRPVMAAKRLIVVYNYRVLCYIELRYCKDVSYFYSIVL